MKKLMMFLSFLFVPVFASTPTYTQEEIEKLLNDSNIPILLKCEVTYSVREVLTYTALKENNGADALKILHFDVKSKHEKIHKAINAEVKFLIAKSKLPEEIVYSIIIDNSTQFQQSVIMTMNDPSSYTQYVDIFYSKYDSTEKECQKFIDLQN